MHALQLATLLLAIPVIHSPAEASTDYRPADTLVHSIEARCHSEKLLVEYTQQGTPSELGLNAVIVGNRKLSERELGKARALIGEQRLAVVRYLGCRRTKAGDVRHWLELEPAITVRNANEQVRSRAFYVLNGRVEVHLNQPVD